MNVSDTIYNGWNDVEYTPIKKQKETYLEHFKHAIEIAKCVPAAVASLSDNLPPCFLYSSDRFVQRNTLDLRIDLFWDLGMLRELVEGLAPNWRPMVGGWWGAHSSTGDYYLNFNYQNTNIQLTVCLSEDNYLYTRGKRKASPATTPLDEFNYGQTGLAGTEVLALQLIAELETACAGQEWWHSDFALPEDLR